MQNKRQETAARHIICAAAGRSSAKGVMPGPSAPDVEAINKHYDPPPIESPMCVRDTGCARRARPAPVRGRRDKGGRHSPDPGARCIQIKAAV